MLGCELLILILYLRNYLIIKNILDIIRENIK